MSVKTILIDAAHREETRIAVLSDNLLQDFDREAYAIKQIKGNIYLAKIIRVEPSLQAAFIDYGGGRHGFLPFGDIHPDYYQLPEAEKQKIRDLALAAQQNNINNENPGNSQNSGGNRQSSQGQRNSQNQDDDYDDGHNHSRNRQHSHSDSESDDNAIFAGSYSVEDETDNYPGNIYNIHKRYNIQDVIKSGQTILVQVTKEERGHKGASMTTYISLAGKYCVLMSNTPNKGGVSKKVDNFRDRKILRSILNDISIPNDRSVIIRTAGVGKRPEDIKRDYEYLSRLWDNIKQSSTSSRAPSFIHSEDDVIKRCIRDIYNEQVSEVIVEGKEAYEAVISFVKLTMPEGARNVRLYDEKVPIFNRYRVEQQISSLYEKQVNLPSGGSIVIDHTEALVAIDVNSGRATKESGVEETAYSTNIEAIKEIARQLRLRDLAGLVVIDFIDMHDQRHRRNVERALRDEMQHDRARIQLGRISVFGLLEMSRQRLGASFFETITDPCKNCNGTGYVRSVEILAVSILRAIRHSCSDRQAGAIHVYTSNEVIAYIMNYKKKDIIATEENYHLHIFMHPAEGLGSSGFNIKKRKSLTDEEKREFDMEIVTGKVNKMGLEKSYMDDLDESFLDEIQPAKENPNQNKNQKYNNPRHQHNSKFKKDRFDNRDRKKNFNNNQKPSLLKSVFSKLFG
jgi:ribonuclease E